MLRNYITIAFRNLVRNKFFSAINIFGLAVSMTIAMAIMMLVADQMSYDRFNSRRDRIYRVITRHVNNDGTDAGRISNSTACMPLRQELLEKYTGVEEAVRFVRDFGNGWLELENQNVNIPLAGYFADPGALTFFEYELQYGDAATALRLPYSVVLTRQAADKLFKEENPLGQTVKVGDIGTYTVTGVIKKTDRKSHIAFEALASMSTIDRLEAQGTFKREENPWMHFWNSWTYIRVEEGKTPAEIQASLDKIYHAHIAPAAKAEASPMRFHLQALMDITPGEFINNPIGPSLPWLFVYCFAGLAAVILLTSCFNFTNLSIARSLTRAREIGVRKVSGAARWQVFTQFLAESVVVAFFALALAVMLLLLVKPLLLQLNFARLFRWDLQGGAPLYALFAAFALLVGVLAGFFPAVVLSGLKPVKVLKNLSNMKLFSRMGLRKALLVSQFTLSLIFILTMIVAYNQLDLFMGKDHGFDMRNNIAVKLNGSTAPAVKTELLKYNNIANVSASSHIPASGMTRSGGFKRKPGDAEWTNLNYFSVDEDYMANLGLKLAAGKFFEPGGGASNENFVLINEEALRALHYEHAHDAVGEAIIDQRDSTVKTIAGVLKNYNHQPLIGAIKPLALMVEPENFGLLQVKYTGSREAALTSIGRAWTAVNPGLKVDTVDLSEEVRQFYNIIFGDIVHILMTIAGLAIMISCLGLLGMATYATETRLKEISIRKVLGSSNTSLVYLLSKGFIWILVIAVIIAVPVSYFLNSRWLELMPYHVSVDVPTVLLGVGLLALFGILTIGSQTGRAALVKPVDNLKGE